MKLPQNTMCVKYHLKHNRKVNDKRIVVVQMKLKNL